MADGKLKAWNAPAGAREKAKARGKSAASKLTAAVKAARAAGAKKHDAVRKIGLR
jgi:hypothetical protein